MHAPLAVVSFLPWELVVDQKLVHGSGISITAWLSWLWVNALRVGRPILSRSTGRFELPIQVSESEATEVFLVFTQSRLARPM